MWNICVKNTLYINMCKISCPELAELGEHDITW